MSYVDLQVNGCYGVDFNDDALRADDFRQACVQLRREGVQCALATVITADIDAMVRRIRRIATLREAHPDIADVIAGIHVEGPFLSTKPGCPGAHPVAKIRPASVPLAEKLVEAGAGCVRLMTLAPECDPQCATTRWLASQGIRIAAGHCDASLDELKQGIDCGVTLYTHLGNGCATQMHRHDNIIQRVLALADRMWITFIADGIHVPWFALKNYMAIAGAERSIIVSDATAAAGRPAGVYSVGGREVVSDEHGATWSPDGSHLVGSAATLPQAANRLAAHLQMTEAQVRRVTHANPLAALQLSP